MTCKLRRCIPRGRNLPELKVRTKGMVITMEFLSYLISGISLGSVYAIIALGYTMVYGIAKMLNFAHGDVIMVGGYVSFCVVAYLKLPGWLSVFAAVLICTVLGVLIEGLAYKPLRRATSLAVLNYCDRSFIFASECRASNMGGGANGVYTCHRGNAQAVGR